MISGADDFVCKPVDPIDLLIRIRALMRWRHLADPVDRLSHYTDTIREETAKLQQASAPPKK